MGKDISSLKEELSNRKTPDDVIAAIICQIDGNQLPASPIKIHKAIFELKQNHQKMLNDFNFFTGNINYFCKLLERVLFRLEQAGLLGTLNPAFEQYEIKMKDKETFKEIALFKFSDEEKSELKNIANELGQILKEA